MRVPHIGPFRPRVPPCAAQFGRCGPRALAQVHHDGFAPVGRAAEPFPDLVLVLDQDAAEILSTSTLQFSERTGVRAKESVLANWLFAAMVARRRGRLSH